MAFFVSVGSVGTSRQNKKQTGARGYEVVRSGNTVICRWAGVYVLGPTTYVWRRMPAITRHRKRSDVAAREFLKQTLHELQRPSRAYVRLGPGVKIVDCHATRTELAQVRRRLRGRMVR